MIDFKGRAEAMRDELVAYRRDFHMHPELAFEEERTASIVAQALNDIGLEVQTGIGKTGVVGLLEGDKDGPTVLLRADMDALPIHELNDTEYKSTVPGKMHACGHDGHTTIALGVAKLMAEQKAHMAGRIKFVFQPAEEIVAGAKAMVEDGVLDDPRPDVSLGLHLWNTMTLGILGVTEGPVMAGSSVFKLTITGKGGHAASPHMTIDPVICAAQIILALQSVVSRNLDPLESAVLSTTMLKASDADNIIPQQVEVSGTFRTFKTEIRDMIEKRIAEISEGVATAMGCTTEFSVRHGTIPTINHPEVTERIRSLFASIDRKSVV